MNLSAAKRFVAAYKENAQKRGVTADREKLRKALIRFLTTYEDEHQHSQGPGASA